MTQPPLSHTAENLLHRIRLYQFHRWYIYFNLLDLTHLESPRAYCLNIQLQELDQLINNTSHRFIETLNYEPAPPTFTPRFRRNVPQHSRRIPR